MNTPIDLENLRQRMHNHDVINDSAVVVLGANEVYEILVALGYCPECGNEETIEVGIIEADGSITPHTRDCTAPFHSSSSQVDNTHE